MRFACMRILSFIFVLFSIQVQAQEFPKVETEKIDGEVVEVPTAFEGKYALIGIGTSKRAEDELRTWQVPVYNKFIAKTGLMDAMFDVEVCFLPLFTGAMRAAKGKVVKRLKENNEKLILNHVYVYSGDRSPFTEFGVDDKKEPYFFLLNPEGEVVWAGQGAFRQEYFDRIEEILSQ